MQVRFRDDVVAIVPETDEEAGQLAHWTTGYAGHVFALRPDAEGGVLELHSLGERIDACREPINVTAHSADAVGRVISNLAETPFELDGRRYRSIESFWQGLKFDHDADRARLAGLDGASAQAAGSARGYGATVSYQGAVITVGTWEHWQQMERACRAKFAQNSAAREALLGTGNRPLIHVVPKDSRAIPGAIMSEIWMRIRRDLHAGHPLV